jgi:hypothetical protein
MAFKPERPTPFNEMAHLDAETVKFALSMRESSFEEEEDWMKDLTDEERAVLEEENKKKKAMARLKPCKVKDCVETEKAVGHNILERVTLQKNIEATTLKVQESSDDIQSLMVLSESTEVELDTLTTKLAALKAKEKKELKEKLVTARKATSQLENQILKLTVWIAKELEEAEAEADIEAKEEEKTKTQAQNSSLPSLDFTLRKIHKCRGKKHTGVFRTSASGFPEWSCCRAEDEDESGCQDDQSVGVKSTLVQRQPASFKPYTIRQMEHVATRKEKFDMLRQPSIAPTAMNKGFRDVRHAPHSQHQQVQLGLSQSQSHFHTTMGDSQVSHPSGTDNGNGNNDSRSRGGGGSVRSGTGSQRSVPEINSPVHHLGRASVSYLESSLARTSHEQMNFTKQRPSTSGANGRMGSMRISYERVTSGACPVYKTVDVGADAYVQKRLAAKAMKPSNESIARLPADIHTLDSASLLASYNASKGGGSGGAVGQRRHLGLKSMRRLHGRPNTATTGPHLEQSNTQASASSLEFYCTRMV